MSKKILKIKLIIKRILWPFINKINYYKFKKNKNLKFNLGCSNKKVNNFINVDKRFTGAVDLTSDLNKFKLNFKNVKCFFSHAFFEHLYKNQRIGHLKSCFKALDNDIGFICYIGLPDFENIAKFYLSKSPGIVGDTFDLFNVYRYTHGDPDRRIKEGWYIEQLHKSLFDKNEIKHLLKESGFKNYTIFSYAFPGDKVSLPVNMGFYSTKNDVGKEKLESYCMNFLKQFDDIFVKLKTVKFIT